MQSHFSLLIKRNKDVVAETIQDNSISDSRIEAFVENWWDVTKIEYKYDEEVTKKY